ncbi:hypothetical protein BT63DRAFT_74172 [Microthyrium microscopicum]|uniref:Homeobox domain-containing protein n=1 Tax=Microthyrium microscopicum TaxID=703497 RepID=A0A6A6U080_9PEZI|nr:hypothetical protein BT63DRAFT_74172 [Microthyrium microscopicum]
MNTTEESRFYSSTFQASSAGMASQTRKRRGNLPKDATRVLRQWFDEHLDAPYPGEEVKNQLCLRTGLQMSQVNNWFINARRRLPRQDRPRKERESTDISEGSPPRDRLQNLRPPGPPDYWA